VSASRHVAQAGVVRRPAAAVVEMSEPSFANPRSCRRRWEDGHELGSCGRRRARPRAGSLRAIAIGRRPWSSGAGHTAPCGHEVVRVAMVPLALVVRRCVLRALRPAGRAGFVARRSPHDQAGFFSERVVGLRDANGDLAAIATVVRPGRAPRPYFRARSLCSGTRSGMPA